MAEDIIVCGRDPRMEFVAGYFYHMGFDVYESPETGAPGSCIITAPKLTDEEERMLACLPYKGQTLWYGVLSGSCLQALSEKQVTKKSYLSLEKLTEQNAWLTARGIVHVASLSAVLQGSHCLVLGYGHCGKAIAEALAQEHAYVDVCVRRKDQKSGILEKGFGYLNFSRIKSYSFDKYSYVFNTVPAPVLNAEVLHIFPDGIVIYDIATAPGGTDFSYCSAHGIRAGLYPGLPGKLYPKEAGCVIASCVYEEQFAAVPLAE